MKIISRTLLCSAIVIESLSPVSLRAADFALLPSIAVEGSFNDNLFLTPDSELSTWRAVVYPGLDLRYATGAFKLNTFASAAINRYIDNANLNTEDQFYRMVSSYDFGRQNVNLNFRYSKIATLRTELADTGELRFSSQRERISINPNWQYLLSEVSRLTVGYNFLQNSYTDPSVNIPGVRQLNGSKQHGANLLLDYSMTNRLRIGSELSYASVSGDTGYTSDNYMLRFPVDYDYSETFRTSVNVGGRYITASGTGTESDGKGDFGFLFGFTFFKKFDIGKIEIALARDVLPSGFGTQRQRDNAKVNLTANLTETLFAGVLTQYIKNEDLGNSSSSSNNREYFEVSPNMRWQWSENWVLNAGYTFRAQNLDSLPGTGYGNLVFMTIGYSFDDVFLPE